jgi:hypothetical protein
MPSILNFILYQQAYFRNQFYPSLSKSIEKLKPYIRNFAGVAAGA